MPNLYIINANYPFGKTETFLENEVNYLAEHFNKIYLFPLNYPSKDFYVRDVPNNVIYQKPTLDKFYYKRIIKFVFKITPVKDYLLDLRFVFKSCKSNYKSKFIRWFLSFMTFRAFYNSASYKFIKNNIQEDDILYFYWGNSRALFANKFKHKSTFVRVHGGEIDLERNKNYIPLLNKTLNLDNCTWLPISNLVSNKIKVFNKNAIVKINRLGTFDLGLGPKPNFDNKIRIVSCSNLIPLKRVHLIIKALEQINDIEIEWTHFGDGVLLEDLKVKASVLSNNTKVLFKGRILNKEILDYYTKNYVDLFINISTTEGVPVSIMEAMSFGIPCFATNVGATCEIVDNKNGILVDSEFEITSLVNVIKFCREKEHLSKRAFARKSWENFSDGDKNYKKLVKIMLKNNVE